MRLGLVWLGVLYWGVAREEVLNCLTVHLIGKIQISFRTLKKERSPISYLDFHAYILKKETKQRPVSFQQLQDTKPGWSQRKL